MELKSYLDSFISGAINEDIGPGDYTSLAIFPSDKKGVSQLLVKQEGILSGAEISIEILKRFDPEIKVEQYFFDGEPIQVNDIVYIAEGKILALLQAERLVLNLVQRMSGIATQTRQYVEAIKGLDTKLLDTRKTTPGLRILEKIAVKHGGGVNHRMGLYDAMMIKDNHIDYVGGIRKAIEMTRDYNKKNQLNLKIICEVRSLADIAEVLKTGGVDRVLLDNFSPELTREALSLIQGKLETESSGGITLANIREYARCGVDYISVGALTHQIRSLDLSLKAVVS